MELNDVLQKMVNFESLVEPQEMVILSNYISQFITDYELQYEEAKVTFSFRWEKMKYEDTDTNTPRTKPLSDKQTEIRMMQDPAYKELMRIKRLLSELKRYRSDLNRKLDVIMGIKRRT